MHIRDLVKQKWADEGLYAVKDVKIQAFLKYIEETPLDCWNEYIKEFRAKYYDLFDELVPPLMKTRDKLLRMTIIRNADLSKPKELNLLEQFVRKARPRDDEPELLAIAKLGHKGLIAELQKHSELVGKLENIVHPQPVLPRKALNIVVPKKKKDIKEKDIHPAYESKIKNKFRKD